jgi:Phage tail tube protein
MAAEKGSAFLLKVGDGAVTPVYSTVAGLRTTQLSINGDAVVITNKGSGAWRELLSGAGVRSVSVSGAGVFTGSAAETRIKNTALSGLLDDCELSWTMPGISMASVPTRWRWKAPVRWRRYDCDCKYCARRSVDQNQKYCAYVAPDLCSIGGSGGGAWAIVRAG